MNEFKNIIFVSILVIFFLIFFSYYVSKSETFKKPEIKAPRNMSGYEEFTDNLYYSDSVAVVMDVRGTGEYNYVVMNCGLGLIQSLGEVGKNITKINVFFIDETNCYYVIPSVKNETLRHEECAKIYENMTYFYIKYGPSFSIFTKNSSTIYVDENYAGNCSVFIRSS
ncbi:MAG: hypothetical protein QXI58_03850 [Candidatus Micrarchaeia archaeon]